jgi:creatinine amidohydrolase
MKLFAELNREQIRAAAPDSLVVLPIGATEQHGPHLATGMDYFTVESVAREAASIAAAQIPVVVTPALPFGSSHHHFVFGGTLSLSTETYYRVLYELVESLVKDGFTRIFLLNGHGGNHELAQLAVRDIVLKHRVRAAAGSY